MLTNSSDFFALQHYASMMISSRPESEALADGTFHKDENVKWHNTAGARKNMLGWDIAPFGLYKLAKWVHRRYSPAGGIVVTENGIPLDEEASEVARRDNHRVCYVKRYLQQLKRAMDEGVAVRRPPPCPPDAPPNPPRLSHPLRSHTPLSSSGARLLLLVVHRQLRVGGGDARALRPRVHRLRHPAPRRQDVGGLLRAPRPDELVHAHAVGVQRHHVGHVALPGGGGRADEAHVRAQRHEPLGPQRHAEQRLGRGGASGSAEGGGLVPTTMKQKVALATRTARCALLAEMQGRHNAEQGEFELMGFWLQKAQKFKAAAGRQKEQLQVMQRQQQQQRRKDEEERQAEAPPRRGGGARGTGRHLRRRQAAAARRVARLPLRDGDRRVARAAADAAPEVQADAAAAWPATAPSAASTSPSAAPAPRRRRSPASPPTSSPPTPPRCFRRPRRSSPPGWTTGTTTAPPAAKKVCGCTWGSDKKMRYSLRSNAGVAWPRASARSTLPEL